MDEIIALVVLIVLCVFFCAVGLLLCLRSRRRSIRSRSPNLILISHWALMLNAIYMILVLRIYPRKSDFFLRCYQGITIVLHFMYYFPYLLRCYRLYFIFNLDRCFDDSDSYFKKNYYRATQRWLVKVFWLMMLPVFVLAGVILAAPEVYKFVPITYKGDLDERWFDSIVYILFSFLEELVFLSMIYVLRNVNDQFKMTIELTLICALWSCNSFFALLPTAYWEVSSVIQNTLIMVVSSLWPLYRSYREEVFDESITYEVLQNMELILLNATALNAFEEFLKTLPLEERTRGENLLMLWYRVSTYNSSLRKSLAGEIVELEQKCFQGCDTDDIDVDFIRENTLNSLKNHYFGLFKVSSQYRQLLREIQKMDIYLSRIMMTSFVEKNPIDSDSYAIFEESSVLLN